MLLWRVQNLLFNAPVQVLCSLVVQLLSRDVVVVLHGLSIALASAQPGRVFVPVVVMVMAAVHAAVCLTFGMLVMLQAVAIAVLVRIAVVMVEAVVAAVIIVDAFIAHGFLWVQGGPLTLRRGAVLPHFINKEDLRHVVDDQNFCPLRDRFGLGSTEMNVHDEDGKRRGCCDHCHGGDVVLPYKKKRKQFKTGKFEKKLKKYFY